MQKVTVLLVMITLLGPLGAALAGEEADPAMSPEQDGKLLFIGQEEMEINSEATFEGDGYIAIRPEEQNSAVKSIAPSECPECEQGCLEPEVTWWNEFSSYGAGLLVITEDETTKCIRLDGFDPTEDVAIYLRVTNDSANEFFVQVRESGTLLFERYVLPKEPVKEELIPSAGRRYTYSISAAPQNAQALPAKVGFVMYRDTNDQKHMMSLVHVSIGDG